PQRQSRQRAPAAGAGVRRATRGPVTGRARGRPAPPGRGPSPVSRLRDSAQRELPVQHTGAQLIPVTLRLAGLAWIVMQVLTIALFARPTPYGEPYLENWTRYFFYAPLYNLIGVVLLATPFLLTGLLT